MKYKIKISISVFSFLFIFCQNIVAQSDTEPLEFYQSKFTFEGEDFEKDVVLIITEESTYLRLNVDGKIKGGMASATLHKKNGRRICSLRLKARDGQAKGNMGEELEVREGVYILKIRNDGGQGYLNVDFSQH